MISLLFLPHFSLVSINDINQHPMVFTRHSTPHSSWSGSPVQYRLALGANYSRGWWSRWRPRSNWHCTRVRCMLASRYIIWRTYAREVEFMTKLTVHAPQWCLMWIDEFAYAKWSIGQASGLAQHLSKWSMHPTWPTGLHHCDELMTHVCGPQRYAHDVHPTRCPSTNRDRILANRCFVFGFSSSDCINLTHKGITCSGS